MLVPPRSLPAGKRGGTCKNKIMISAQLFRYVADNSNMDIRTQLTAPCSSALSTSVNRFDFLTPEEREPAQLSYEFFSGLIGARRVMPSRVWFDLDGTLGRKRKEEDPIAEEKDSKEEPIIFQGAVVGAMLVFAEAGVDVGIFSFWSHVHILMLIKKNPFLSEMVSRVSDGAPLIRGLEHINLVAESLAAPEYGMHAVFDEKYETICFDTQPEFTENSCRAMKIIGPGEMLIDDEPAVINWNIVMYLSQGNFERAEKLPLLEAVEQTGKGYLELDDPDVTPIPKYLSQAEKDRALEIFERLERDERICDRPPSH